MNDAGLQLPLGIQLREANTLDNFVSGPNSQAIHAARVVVDTGRGSVYLQGAAGTGKSHLLQAVCRQAAGNARSAYLPLGQFGDQPPAVLAGLDRLDILCVDELDAIAGIDAWEQALTGLFDHIRLAGGSLLLAGRAAPDKLGLKRADLSSRLGWGGVYVLQQLGDDDKRLLLQQRAQSRGMHLPDEVVDFLLRRARRDMASLIGLLDQLDHASLVAKRRLTIPFVKQALGL